MERAVQKRRKGRFSPANLAWLCPLALLVVMPGEQIGIYIRQLDLYLPPAATYWGTLLLTALLMAFTPLRRIFARGGAVEACYCLFPATVLLTMVFAQHHFWLCLLLVILSLAAAGGAFLLAAGERTLSGTKWRAGLLRLMLVSITAVLLAPCLCVLAKYGFSTPRYPAQQSGLTVAEEDARPTRETLLAENPQVLSSLSGTEWGGLGTNERLDLLQHIADIEAASLGIPSVPLYTGKLEALTLGSYSPSQNQITIDIRYLGGADPEDCVGTIAHEVFHAYQTFVVDSLDWEGVAAGCAYFDQALAWKENSARYYTGGPAYLEQPLEADARAYAGAAVPAYCGEE